MVLFRMQALKKIKEAEIYGFDVETNPDGSFNFASICTPAGKMQLFKSEDEAITWLTSEKPMRTFVTGLNLAYDFNSLFPRFNPERILGVTGNFISLAMCENKKNKDKYINVIELGAFFPGKSLKSLAEEFNFEYIDVHDIVHPDIEKACISHSRSAAQILNYLRNICNNLGFEIKLTAASNALRCFQVNFLDKTQVIHDKFISIAENEKLKEISLNTYKGGACEVFKKNERIVTMIDVISMYPTMMLKTLPDMNTGVKLLEKDFEWFITKNMINIYEGMALVNINIPDNLIIPPFLYQDMYNEKGYTKQVAKTGQIVGWLNFVDIRYCISLGCTIEYLEIITFKPKNSLFKNHVNHFFTMKNDKSNQALKPFAKLMLNSLYGKFGEKPHIEINYIEIGDNESIDIEEHYEENGFKHEMNEAPKIKQKQKSINKKEMKIYKYGNSRFMRKEKQCYADKNETKLFPEHSYPLIASYITSYARQYLHETMTKIGHDKIVMCDTDSIAFEGTIEDAIKAGVSIGHELGDFELKWSGKIQCVRPKVYKYMNLNETVAKKEPVGIWQYVIKGVPKRYMKDFWNNGFKVILQKPRKYFTAIRTNKPINEWVTIEYHMNPCMQKRFFNNDGSSRAYNDNDKIQTI